MEILCIMEFFLYSKEVQIYINNFEKQKKNE